MTKAEVEWWIHTRGQTHTQTGCGRDSLPPLPQWVHTNTHTPVGTHSKLDHAKVSGKTTRSRRGRGMREYCRTWSTLPLLNCIMPFYSMSINSTPYECTLHPEALRCITLRLNVWLGLVIPTEPIPVLCSLAKFAAPPLYVWSTMVYIYSQWTLQQKTDFVSSLLELHVGVYQSHPGEWIILNVPQVNSKLWTIYFLMFCLIFDILYSSQQRNVGVPAASIHTTQHNTCVYMYPTYTKPWAHNT